ncbi:phage major capsid protein [Bacillus thuringiensis]|uniref:Phage major capsid protein n=1 Tax=Bacillus thuringiensis TaxID=1428 RepID=A0ABD6RX43_BACTU|nr:MULTISPECIES: phage major capsid protein [Bacillus cereus group]KAA6469356.1 phage major capsid protein [Bacillus cereus]KAA6478981.1 phage major capsid protein [Bacillus cereus]KAB2417963.1 phage major capsid protein [Bacillus cereus]KAB2434581.1 phage major capsid protein [Bacillus cereus]KAB2471817.1 phage major capsid protein [Bacillus cereus]
MTIRNLDRPVIENKDQQIINVQEAFETGDAQVVAARIVANMENNMQHFQDMMNDVISEAQQAKNENWDAQVLASRGVRILTNDEKKFYNAAIEANSFNETHKLMPPTIFERVFEELEKEHPLLSLVNFQTVGATTQWIVRKEGSASAYWGDVCDEIKEMIDEGFTTIDQGMYKLSGFLVVCKAMFELGPEWLDKYVRTFMKEVVAEELERVIVMGTGKKQPIGMIKDLKGSVKDGIYPDKEKVVLEDFTPVTIGKKILAPTTKDGTKRYTGVTLIVNPLDYATKFFPIGAKQKDDGTWTYDNFGVPGLTIVQSPAVPLNTMISGKPKDYFMGVASKQELVSDDTVRLIQDQRLYLIRQLANGRPLDHDSFTVFDITALEPKVGTTTP